MEEIVHIAPVGWERSRIVEPIKSLKAHRVFILYRPDYQQNYKFVDKIIKDLKNENVEVIRKIIDKYKELDSLLFHIGKIIISEYFEQNKIYLNLSSSGKIAAAATY